MFSSRPLPFLFRFLHDLENSAATPLEKKVKLWAYDRGNQTIPISIMQICPKISFTCPPHCVGNNNKCLSKNNFWFTKNQKWQGKLQNCPHYIIQGCYWNTKSKWDIMVSLLEIRISIKATGFHYTDDGEVTAVDISLCHLLA